MFSDFPWEQRVSATFGFSLIKDNKVAMKVNYKNLGLGACVVLQYADEIPKIKSEASFNLFFDNIFTSIPLMDVFQKRGLKTTETERMDYLNALYA